MKELSPRANFGLTISKLGFATDIKDAFRKYVGKGKAAYIPRAEIIPHQAVQLIVKHGGVPVLAHPKCYGLPEELDTLVKELSQVGLKGIECIYPFYTEDEKNAIKALASRYNLFITGGTDFHGAIKPNVDLGTGPGDMEIPYEILANLKA
jgi:predicted metal-dependent phosphoesterase TrpH